MRITDQLNVCLALSGELGCGDGIAVGEGDVNELEIYCDANDYGVVEGLL